MEPGVSLQRTLHGDASYCPLTTCSARRCVAEVEKEGSLNHAELGRLLLVSFQRRYRSSGRHTPGQIKAVHCLHQQPRSDMRGSCCIISAVCNAPGHCAGLQKYAHQAHCTLPENDIDMTAQADRTGMQNFTSRRFLYQLPAPHPARLGGKVNYPLLPLHHSTLAHPCPSRRPPSHSILACCTSSAHN